MCFQINDSFKSLKLLHFRPIRCLFRYDMWLKGEDIGPHPEEPDKKVPAPLPLPQDILCNKNNPFLPQSFLDAPKKGKRGRCGAYK